MNNNNSNKKKAMCVTIVSCEDCKYLVCYTGGRFGLDYKDMFDIIGTMSENLYNNNGNIDFIQSSVNAFNDLLNDDAKRFVSFCIGNYGFKNENKSILLKAYSETIANDLMECFTAGFNEETFDVTWDQ